MIVVLAVSGTVPSLPPALLIEVRQANPGARWDTNLVLLAQDELSLDEAEALGGEAFRAEGGGDERAHEALGILGNHAVDPAVRERGLLSLWQHGSAGRHAACSEIFEMIQLALRSRPSDLVEPSTWDHLQLPLPRPDHRPPSVRPPPSERVPVRVESIFLEHLRAFDELRLDPSPPADPQLGQWTIILGENGVGKSTMLRSVVLALLSDLSVLPTDARDTAWRRNGMSPEAVPRVTVVLHGNRRFRTRIDIEDGERFHSEQCPARVLLFAYGCRRGSALGGNAREVNYKPGAEIATLFQEGASLIQAETWLALRHGAAKENESKLHLFNTVIDALKGMLPGVDDIWVANMRVMVSGSTVKRVPLAALSDGYLTTAGWVLDLVARWVDQAERRGEPIESGFTKTMTGLVLVDEIDLHLHPEWQRRVIDDVRALFPRMSFIVTTHNPLTLLGARAEEIWKLERDGDARIVAVQGRERPELMTSSEIYNSYFGIASLFPSALGEMLNRYGFLARDPVRNDAEDAEMLLLLATLLERGVEPGIEPVERESIPPYPGSAPA